MSIYATPLDNASLKSLLQRTSTKIQFLVYEIKSLQTMLAQVADNDLKAIIAAGEGLVVGVDDAAITAIFSQVRDWQFHVNNLADNYVGVGSLADISFHVAKRVVL